MEDTFTDAIHLDILIWHRVIACAQHQKLGRITGLQQHAQLPFACSCLSARLSCSHRCCSKLCSCCCSSHRCLHAWQVRRGVYAQLHCARPIICLDGIVRNADILHARCASCIWRCDGWIGLQAC